MSTFYVLKKPKPTPHGNFALKDCLVLILGSILHSIHSVTYWYLHRVFLGPVPGVSDGLGLVELPQFGDVVGERVVRVGGGEQRLDRQQHSADLERGTPLV